MPGGGGRHLWPQHSGGRRRQISESTNQNLGHPGLHRPWDSLPWDSTPTKRDNLLLSIYYYFKI